jgi:hypothetical protein
MGHSGAVRHSRRGDRLRRKILIKELEEKKSKELASASKAKTEVTRLKHEAVAADISAALKRLRRRKKKS